MTKQQAHWFTQAPDTFSALGALRYGQAVGFGSTPRMAAALAASAIGRDDHVFDTAREEFWVSVMHFFIRHEAMFDLSQVDPLLDYLRVQRIGDAEQPAQPNLSMKGRTPETLLRQMEDWHRRLARVKTKVGEIKSWPSCGIPNFLREEGQDRNRRLFEINEILTSNELRAEGTAMRHCVSTYAGSCARGSSAIYSLKDNGARMVTIEVQPKNRTIVQVRGLANKVATPQAERLLRAWAVKSDLQITTAAIGGIR